MQYSNRTKNKQPSTHHRFEHDKKNHISLQKKKKRGEEKFSSLLQIISLCASSLNNPRQLSLTHPTMPPSSTPTTELRQDAKILFL